MERRKRAFLAAIREHGGVKRACEQADLAIGTLATWQRPTTSLQASLEDAENVRWLALQAKIDDAIDHPDDYADAMKHSTWDLLTMFRMKRLDPAHRDNTIICGSGH